MKEGISKHTLPMGQSSNVRNGWNGVSWNLGAGNSVQVSRVSGRRVTSCCFQSVRYKEARIRSRAGIQIQALGYGLQTP